jgi:AcrR family transcriptional regulator
MAISREELEQLYIKMSVQEIADTLGMKKSTVYYWIRKHGIQTRNRTEAQKLYVDRTGQHQRSGKKHDDATRAKIGEGLRRFWDSEDGQENRQQLSDLRSAEWKTKSTGDKRKVLDRLRNASRPSSDELSRIGSAFLSFLEAKGESAKAKVGLVDRHLSDLVLERDKIIIEFVLPTAVYGDEAARATEARYTRLVNHLVSIGYRVLIVIDKSNHISQARCQRIYESLVEFRDKNTKDRLTVES